MTTAHIDGDIPCYSIGFVTEEEPLRFALNTVNRFIKNIKKNTGAEDVRIFLTGDGNFRETIATVKPYKGNRADKAKPKWWKDIRDYLVVERGAEVFHGIEADDALGLEQTENTVLCTLDKDLDMIAGRHYNWKKDQLYDVLQENADRFFMEQWLAGDSTDNIVGIPRVGLPTAKKYLSDCTSIYQMHRVVQHYYDPFGEEYMAEMASLIWMQRKEYITYKEWLDVV